MKYGETLQQRSVPEWGAYNIDYNDIKRLIKERTHRGHGPPSASISIPGQSLIDNAPDSLEAELFTELKAQHERIDLFVNCKAGEITRKLDHLRKQVLHLFRQHKATSQTLITVTRLERLSKVEGDILKAGEELQFLDRFVSAQRLAFHKLLKKYKKWTGSSSLGERFRSEVLDQGSSFINRDFGPLLAEYTDVLAEVRAPFEAGLTWRASQASKESKASKADGNPVDQHLQENAVITRDFQQPPSPKSIAAELSAVFENGSDVDVDTALATLPLGVDGGRAAYWVHSDNLVQMHILLLQSMRLWRSKDYLASCRSSNEPSRRGSAHGSSNDTAFLVQEETETIVCDNLKNFVQRQNTATIANLEARSGTGGEDTTTSIRYSSASEAIVVVGTKASATTISNLADTSKWTKVKRKSLRHLFSNQTKSSPSHSTLHDCKPLQRSSKGESEGFERVRQWLQSHQDIQPLVQLTCRRTRFVGLGNGDENGIWATLDKNVSMRKTSLKDLNTSKADQNPDHSVDTSWFPHAILEVRWEGRLGEDFVKTLDRSHLAERVRGFTLETHAVATLCHPAGMSGPFWLPALEKDIRKLPPKVPLSHRQSSKQTTPESASTRPTSTSASIAGGIMNSDFSTAARPDSPATSVPIPTQLEAPPLKAFKKKRRSRPRKTHLSSEGPVNGNSQRSEQRYWNEFDDGDDPADEVYTVLVDPNEVIPFPGKEALSRMTRAIKSWFQPSEPKDPDPECQTLLSEEEGHFSQRPRSPLSVSSTSALSALTPHRLNQYSTFPPLSDPSDHASSTRAHQDRDTLLARCCAASFAASFLLLFIAGILDLTRRRKFTLAADMGIATGLVASVVFAVLGTLLFWMRRREDVGWVERGVVGVSWAILGVGWGVLGWVSVG